MPRGETREGQVPFSELGGDVVIEEKLDDTQLGISYADSGELILQSRGGEIDLSSTEFGGLAWWYRARENAVFDRLGSRYILFGAWMRHAHTIFYDTLPDVFLEYDVYDREQEAFLDTSSRHALLDGLGICHVPVLAMAPLRDAVAARSWILPSLYRSPRWEEVAATTAANRGLAHEPSRFEGSRYGEGLYIKREEGGVVTGRYKFIRPEFLDHIRNRGQHWRSSPSIPNIIDFG
jgi:hypothetical protein